ncbi:MAG TPA: hypothetical protein PKD53_24555 [Chloroflexaceae bacterium]|nr:hypothetical protein [Chloroflexaceae bacterium]
MEAGTGDPVGPPGTGAAPAAPPYQGGASRFQYHRAQSAATAARVSAL